MARSAVLYDDASRPLILSFKHGDRMHLHMTFGPWLKRAGAEFLQDCDMVVPVPLHWRRMVARRYNQSALLAESIARGTGIEYRPSLLKRIRHTPVQGHLSAKDRYRNVKSAFVVAEKSKAEVRGKKIVLVDDVYTTGATIEECAKTLYEAGAARIDVLTVARVSRPDSIS